MLFGCISSRQPQTHTTKSVCVEKIKNDLRGNWKLSEDSVYYQTNNNFLIKLDSVYDQCINMLDQNEIIDLFGNPTRRQNMKGLEPIESSFDYLVSLPCKEDVGNTRCKYFVFYFDSDLKVIRSDMTSIIGIRSH